MRSILILAALAAVPAIAGAQRSRTEDEKNSSTVPVSMLPPVGKCRIWMIGVPPAQQPAPTDCQTALRQRPENGVVIFGPVEREGASSAFSGRPTPEPGNDRRTTSPRDQNRGTTRDATGGSAGSNGAGGTVREPVRETVREPNREPSREPARQPATAPARTESRAPSNEPRRESPARPPSGTARPTQDPPVKKPPTERPPSDHLEIAAAAFRQQMQGSAS
jgi:hypothetical protein